MQAFDLVDTWPVERCAVRVLRAGDEIARHGTLDAPVRWASITKVLSAWAVLVATEEGSVSLDDPAGPPGSTIRHLLSHASGYPFMGTEPVAPPGERRIYSNTGYDVLAAHLERATGMPFATYLHEAVLAPLDMSTAELRGSPAKDMDGTVADLVRFVTELMRPRLLAPETVAQAVRPQFPELKGVVPGVGAFDPCPWGLGPEVKGDKHPHWTGSQLSASTFGHFGGSGTYLWVDPTLDAACVVLAELEFDNWAMTYWPAFNNALVDELTAVAAR